ncbi:RNA-splicing factor [Ceratobasidium sp. 394]|nr:RNA-splicing factor [Ceratobasidium sp. 394]
MRETELAEKKKLDQLRKELEEERQLQELQRLQEAQTGKKKVEKLEWTYSTPATGGGPSANDLEDYLLGKKCVDQMLTVDEVAKVRASHKNFIAVQNANTVHNTAAKIREDPMFAIKQQEQAEYAALMTNPLHLRALKERAGIVEDKVKDKEERKRLKKEKKKERQHRDERSLSPRSRRQDGEHGRGNAYPKDDRSLSSERERSPQRSSRYDDSPPRRSRYDSPPRRRHYDDSPPQCRHSNNTPPRDRSRSRSPIGRGGSGSGSGHRSRSPDCSYPRRARSRSPPAYRHRSPPPRRRSPPPPRRPSPLAPNYNPAPKNVPPA